MDKRIATNALAFLQRVQLTGSEAGVFVEVTEALQAIAQAEPEAPAEAADWPA